MREQQRCSRQAFDERNFPLSSETMSGKGARDVNAQADRNIASLFVLRDHEPLSNIALHPRVRTP